MEVGLLHVDVVGRSLAEVRAVLGDRERLDGPCPPIRCRWQQPGRGRIQRSRRRGPRPGCVHDLETWANPGRDRQGGRNRSVRDGAARRRCRVEQVLLFSLHKEIGTPCSRLQQVRSPTTPHAMAERCGRRGGGRQCWLRRLSGDEVGFHRKEKGKRQRGGDTEQVHAFSNLSFR